jgi:hypothetical protein
MRHAPIRRTSQPPAGPTRAQLVRLPVCSPRPFAPVLATVRKRA